MKKTTVKKASAKAGAVKKKTAKAASSKKKTTATKTSGGSVDASKNIDARIEELGDWRGKTLAKIRGLMKEALPGVIEEWKWRGVPVWNKDGIICTGETYKSVVKLTFPKGAAMKDPHKLFNSSLEGNARRAIDIGEGEKIDEKALKALFKAAAELNAAKPAKRKAE